MKTTFLIGVPIAGVVLISGRVEKERETGTDCLVKDCFTAGCVK